MTVAQRLANLNHDQNINLKALEFGHVARWLAFGKGQLHDSLAAAQGARATERIIEGIKASVNAGTTQDGTWAAPLAYQELSDGFLSSLRNIGVFDAALPFTKQIPLNTACTLTSLGATAASIGEGQAKVISKLSFAASALNPRKAVAILIASAELLRASRSASVMFQQELSRAVVAETDNRFLSVISTSISPTASQGSNAFGIASDMAALMAGLSLGSDSKVFIAMNPADVKHMAVQIANNGERAFPTVNINGGNYAGAEIISTDALSGSIIAFDAVQLVCGSTGIALDASNQAAIQMESAPDSPPTSATSMTAFWQNNLTGLRATRYFGCERLRTAAVSVINSVSYGSANSPA